MTRPNDHDIDEEPSPIYGITGAAAGVTGNEGGSGAGAGGGSDGEDEEESYDLDAPNDMGASGDMSM